MKTEICIRAASIWKVNIFAPASFKGVTYLSGFSTIKWQSRKSLQSRIYHKTYVKCFLRDLTTGAPIVRLGTE